jgi:very-short-patch-repair endonuclease
MSHDLKGDYDEKRDACLKSLGLTVLHFTDKDIKKSLGDVLVHIEEWIKDNA